MQKKEKQILQELFEANPDILAVVLFGSQSQKTAHAVSDIDLCLVMPAATDKVQHQILLQWAGRLSDSYDVKVFEELPLMVKGEVIKEGTVLFSRDADALFEYFWKWKKIYDDFKYQYALAYTPTQERIRQWKKRKKDR